MKRSLLAAATCLAAAVSAPALAADVGVSVTVGQPGFYGHIDIGDAYPAPALIYPQPVFVRPAPPGLEPLYLHVPPGHYKNWKKHCARYDACGRPVYFVQDSWYNNVYVPRYRERHDHDHYDNDRGDHGDRGDRGDRGWDNDHGPGKGHGNGKGHGRGHDKD